jgi:CBS domain-containing protein
MKKGCVEEESIEEALRIQVDTRKEIGEILVEMGAIKESDLGEALSLQSDLINDRSSDKAAFLGQVEPFSGLDPGELAHMAGPMEWILYSPGEAISKEGEETTTFSIVKSGLAKISVEKDGNETVIGFLGEGEFCGATALLSNGISPSSVVAIEPTLCLSQPKESFVDVIARQPGFAAFFSGLIVNQSRKILAKALSAGCGAMSQTEPFLYGRQVKDLLSPIQVFCDSDTTLREAARRLVEQNGQAAVVLNDKGGLAGTVGLKRLVEASLLDGMDPHGSVGAIVEADCRIVGSDRYFFDALHEMMKHGTDRLIVVTGEKVEGVLTSLDLLRFRGREALSLVRNVDDARDFAELDAVRRDVEQVLRSLVSDGALASHACKIVSELYDRITGRVIELVEEGLGAPPCPYAWLGLGSEGRKEQTLLTDQDNALLFDEFNYGKTVDGAEDYFRTLADRVVHGLDACGFPLCKGNIMAVNDRYFGNLTSWKSRAKEWIGRDAEAGRNLLDIYTFLDFRVVYGSRPLEQSLRAAVEDAIRLSPVSLRALADPVVNVPVPLGFFKDFAVEKNGKYKNTVNIKTNGLLPLTTCAKLLALHSGITAETNTLERLKLLTDRGVLNAEEAESMGQAFETFLTLKLHGNLSNRDEGRDFSNNVNPATLTAKQKQLLKGAFLAVSRIQKVTKDLLKVMD